jgi:hypothetical protein
LLASLYSNNYDATLLEVSVLGEETKQERREKKQQKKRAKILQHGRSLVRVYKDAVLKRAKQLGRKEGDKR